MKQTSFYLSLLKYAVIHPKDGLDLFCTSLDVKRDSRKKATLKVEHKSVNEALKEIFPTLDSDTVINENEINFLNTHLKEFFNKLENEAFPSKKKPYPIDYSLNNNAGLLLFNICKFLKPNKVLETGVAYGNSSSHMLMALSSNEKGNLYSIDYTFRPWESKEMIGSAIPKILKNRWHLTFGKSKNKLQNILDELQEIDIFFHDSLHTYKNMIYEYKTSWPHIRDGGLLISDDVTSNNAFKDFCSSKNISPIIVGDQNWALGIITKQ